MNFIEYRFTISPLEPWRDVLLAFLSELQFESFVETDFGLIGYITEDLNDEASVQEVLAGLSGAKIDFECSVQEKKNWNAEWEKSFQPVIIADKIYVHADFHPKRPDIDYAIEITPKMSFGTGHHETTALMLEHMLEHDFQGSEVLDMGCGTGVLAIFSAMKGANAFGVDIDEWAVENAQENAKKNSVEVEFLQGETEALDGRKFDYVIANINKNILLEQIPTYAEVLETGGKLFLSGLLIEDEEDIMARAAEFGFKLQGTKRKLEWSAMVFEL